MRWVALALVAALGCSAEDSTEIALARRGDLVIGVEVSGTLKAVDSTPVRPPGLPNVWNFKLAFMVPEGTEVKKGDRLVGFDTSELMRELEGIKNDAESAETEIRRQTSAARMARQNEKLAQAERDAAVKKLGLKADQPEELVSLIEQKTNRIDRDIAEIQASHERSRSLLASRSDAATLAGYRDKLDYARGRLAQLQQNIARMTVAAERAGTVIHPTTHRGEKLKVGDGVWRMQTVVEVVSLDKMLGNGTVDEVDSSRVAVGRPFTLRVDAHPNTELVGVVSKLADGFTAKSEADPSKVVRVELEIEDAKGLPLRPGMRFRGEIEVERVANTISVPIAAVFITGGGPVVYRKSGDDFEKVSVTVGARSAKEIEIKSGLSAGDQVALTLPEGA